jgi:hypothetical protein
VITAVSGWLASLLGGAFFVEYIFNWKGLGWETIHAVETLDFPVVMGTTLLVALIFILINIVVDVSTPCSTPASGSTNGPFAAYTPDNTVHPAQGLGARLRFVCYNQTSPRGAF